MRWAVWSEKHTAHSTKDSLFLSYSPWVSSAFLISRLVNITWTCEDVALSPVKNVSLVFLLPSCVINASCPVRFVERLVGKYMRDNTAAWIKEKCYKSRNLKRLFSVLAHVCQMEESIALSSKLWSFCFCFGLAFLFFSPFLFVSVETAVSLTGFLYC